MINNDLTTRLRKRITTIPKPGSKPFDPPAGFAYTTMMGGEHKPGDPAGYASVNVNLTGCSTAQSVFKMQEMVYAEEPLSWEAAAAIEQLQAELADCHRVITIWDASDLKARPAVEQYARAERAETERDALRAELEAVKEYAQHKPHCEGGYGGQNCTCGLYDVLREDDPDAARAQAGGK